MNRGGNLELGIQKIEENTGQMQSSLKEFWKRTK